MRRSVLPLALAAAFLAGSGGCSWFRRKPKPAPPPPPAAAPAPAPRLAEAAMPEPKLPEPTVPVPKPEPRQVTEAPKAPVAEPPKPVPERKPARRSRRSRQAAGPKPAAQEPAPASPAAPPPRLGEVLTTSQRSELLGQLETNLSAARQILNAMGGRTLTREQSESSVRVRGFIEQALGLKESDLGAAVELSRRALVLAQDLAKSSP